MHAMHLPPLMPCVQGCPEDALTPTTILLGYKDTAADVGIPEAHEHGSAVDQLAPPRRAAAGAPRQQGHLQGLRKVRWAYHILPTGGAVMSLTLLH